ncbi:MAG: zinc dependent phospholipase C family protein [Nitrospirota bacterium]
MAGTFTHWMIVEEALDKFNRLSDKHPYFPIILGNSHFVTLGAVGPDYPYLSELANNLLKLHSWADRMHYENTGEFIKYGITNLLKLNKQDFETCLSWLCGYVTHLLADSIVHPAVNATVGLYLFNSNEHRHCEMIQDTFIFHDIKKIELRYAGYVDLIKMCSDPSNEDRINPAIKNCWTETLKMSHPGGKDKFDKIDPDDWHENFLSIISKVSDSTPIFRHIGEAKHLFYKKVGDITLEERKKFIEAVKLPGNKIGRFKEDVFDKAVDKVIEVWQKLFIDIEQKNPDNCITQLSHIKICSRALKNKGRAEIKLLMKS